MTGVPLVKDHQALYLEVGRRIRNARKDRKLSQEDLASLVSLTRTSITNIEKGRQKFLLSTFVDIAHALRVETATLLPEVAGEPEKELEKALKNRSDPEKVWIKSALLAVRKGESDDRP
jgi:transcriptional regulator with XRE-family HTH domain